MGGKQTFAIIAAITIGVFAFAYRDLWWPEKDPQAIFHGTEIVNARLQDGSGYEVKLADLLSKGPSKTVLAMWATWCDPCTRELPEIQKKLSDYEKAGIRVILINYDGPSPEKSLPEVKAWMTSQKIELTTYFDFGEEILKTYGISGLPFAIGITDPKKVSWMKMGELEWERPPSILSLFR